MDLENKVKTKKAKIAVVGLGYVGLPLLLLLSDIGFAAVGIDRNPQKISQLKKGHLDFLKNNLKAKRFLKRAIKKTNFRLSESFEEISNCSFIFVAVDTPIDQTNKPDQRNIISASTDIGRFLSKGTVVIIESTVAPTTTTEIITPLIEKLSKLKANKDFFVAVCSERVRPSFDVFADMENFPRVIGTSDKRIDKTMKIIYQMITKGEIDIVDTVTAEVVKCVENSLRDVKIAFSNEVALLSEELKVNVLQVRELINKRSGVNDMLLPGPGVGGHCLPKDPWLLLSAAKTKNARLIPAARAINESMPQHTFELLKAALAKNNLNIEKITIAVLGYSYIENCEDTRNSPTKSLLAILKDKGIHYRIHDAYVHPFNQKVSEEIIANADCLVLMVAHNQYRILTLKTIAKIMRHKIIVDTKNFYNKLEAKRLGFTYKGIGNV